MGADLIDAENGKDVNEEFYVNEDEEDNKGVSVEDKDVNERVQRKKENLEAVIKIPKKNCIAIPCNLCGVVGASVTTLQKHKTKTHKTKSPKCLTEIADNEETQEDSGDLVTDDKDELAQNEDSEMDH